MLRRRAVSRSPDDDARPAHVRHHPSLATPCDLHEHRRPTTW
ncbi:hypothetical protein CZ771_13235 [Actinomycetales bacterium JB111]|nr:hypothetical protein CZ771_13235 [Actinomycetales bacterium JB111]